MKEISKNVFADNMITYVKKSYEIYKEDSRTE